jgi:hypothetical protein
MTTGRHPLRREHVTHTAYQWHGDLFCERDIVSKLTDDAPWSAWIDDEHVPGDLPAEDELDEIADKFGIDRDDEIDCARRNFPVRLATLPDPPSFCSECLSWFT